MVREFERDFAETKVRAANAERLTALRGRAAAEAALVAFDFSFDEPGPIRWGAPTGNPAQLAVRDGALCGRITGRDPWVMFRTPGIRGDDAPAIYLRMRVTAATQPARFYWTTEAEPDLDEAKRLHFAVRPDGEYHNYRLELGNHPKWAAQTLTNIRVDPGHGADAGEFAIDYIRGVKELPEAPDAKAEALKAGKGVRLFDGKTLDGWRVIDEMRVYGQHSHVRAEEGQIILESGHPHAGIVWTRWFPSTNYEVRMDARRVGGSQEFCDVALPAGSALCALRLTCSDSLARDSADTIRKPDKGRTRKGRWYRVRVRVTTGRIEAWINQEKLIDLATAGRPLTLPDGMKCFRPFGMEAVGATTALRGITLLRVGGPADKQVVEVGRAPRAGMARCTITLWQISQEATKGVEKKP